MIRATIRDVRPAHAAVLLFAGFFAAQTIGMVLSIAGLAVALATGQIDRSLLDSAGLLGIFGHPLILLPSAVGSSAGFVLVAVAGAIFVKVPVREALAIRPAPLAAWILVPIGVLGTAFVADQAVYYFGRALPWLTIGALEAFGQAARTDHPGAAVAVWIAMALVPGTCEEIFFRGAVQGALASRWRGAAAVGLTAAAFGAIHVDPPQALGAGLLGLYLGAATLHVRSVGPAIVAHVLNNSVAFAMSRFPEAATFGYGTDRPVPWVLVGVAAATAVAAFWATLRWGRIPQ